MMQGEQLRAIRKRMEMTQREFAAALGINGSFLGLMERNERPIEPRTALAARELLNGGHEPGRVSVASFGDKFLVIISERDGLGLRVHRAMGPAHAQEAAAIAAASELAESKGLKFLSI